MRFDWTKLLCDTRVSGIDGANQSLSTVRTAGDPRSEFQSDYDRILFSTALRRLQDKAQVFPLEPNDFVRTRLTHSLEVANVAQGIARRVCQDVLRSREGFTPAQEASVVAITGACGLIHDMGNPPFGHAGEEAMRLWFKKLMDKTVEEPSQNLGAILDSAIPGVRLSEDFRQFDGNPQTLRLVTRLQMLGDFDGLNLTIGTLSASLKYIARSDKTTKQHAHSKTGFFYSESKIVSRVREITGTGESRNPLTFLVEAADDIVYSAVDLEDGFKKGAFSWEQLREEMRKTDAAAAFETVLSKVDSSLAKRRSRAVDLELSSKAENEAKAQLLRTILINMHVESVSEAFKKNYDKIMSGEYEKEILADSDTADLWRACKKFSHNHVFPMPSILRLELMGQRVITDLLDVFWVGAAPDESARKGFARKAYRLLSENYRAVFDHEVSEDLKLDKGHKVPIQYRKLQLIADYISGMTDTFATQLHKELFNA